MTVPTPRRTVTSVPMPFAQNPSILPSSSALAAVKPKLTVVPEAPVPERWSDRHVVTLQVDARFDQKPAKAHLDPRRRTDATPANNADIAALGPNVGAHNEEPVSALACWDLRAADLKEADATDPDFGATVLANVRGRETLKGLKLPRKP